jgi:hypothetical protein
VDGGGRTDGGEDRGGGERLDLERLGYELGGTCGVDPRPFTLRELLWMSKGRGALAWGTTASIVRASILAISGKEPPLESFIPKPYLPEFAKRELTAEEKELMESLGAETVEEAAAIWAEYLEKQRK